MASPARTLVIGLGSGRCGSLSLAAMLNAQDDAVVLHEGSHRCGDVTLAGAEEMGRAVEGHLPWKPDTARLSARLAAITQADARFVGDVAFYYLPYVADIMSSSALPVRFVCLKRDMEETVRSFLAHTRGRNHWLDHDGRKWALDPVWDSCFPSYNSDTKAEALYRYWREYYSVALEYERSMPNFRVYDLDVLNDEARVEDLLAFIGIRQARPSLTGTVKQTAAVSRAGTKFVLVVGDAEPACDWVKPLTDSVESVIEQAGADQVKVCVADYSMAPLRDDLPRRTRDSIRYKHFKDVGEANASFAVNLAFRSFCADEDGYLIVSRPGLICAQDFLERAIDIYVSTERSFCVSAVVCGEERAAGPVATGVCLLISCRLFEELGGFDETLDTYELACEDFTERAAERGAYFIDRNMHVTQANGMNDMSTNHRARDEDSRRLGRKRRGEISWRDWGGWGSKMQRRAVRAGIKRYMVPVCCREFELTLDDDKGLVLADGRRTYAVNEAGAAIFELCDGERTVGSVIDAIQIHTGVLQEQLQMDVRDGLLALEELGAIRLVDPD